MRFQLPLPSPFGFEAVLKTHGWFQLAPFHWDPVDSVLYWAMTTPGVPLQVRLRFSSHATVMEPSLEVEVDSDLAGIESEVAGRLRRVFNLDLDLADFYRICWQKPHLEPVPNKGMGRLMKAESVYEDVFKTICGSNIQWKQAVKVVNTIASHLGETPDGGLCTTFPRPRQVLEAGEDFLRQVGRVGYRAPYLLDLCRRADEDVDLGAPDLARVDEEECFRFFVGFQGIGKTGARFLSALNGHYHRMSVDSLVISYMKKTHFAGDTPSEKQVEEFYADFGRWRALAYWMEFILAGGWTPS